VTDPSFADLAIEVVRLELAALEYLGGWFPGLTIVLTVLVAGAAARLVIVARQLRR
jgi:hypothetical protein